MKDFMQMFEQFKEAQKKLQEIQQKLSYLQATGEAGAGLVKATVNGYKNLIKIEIDPSIIQPDDQKILQDLVIAATNSATQKVEEQIKEQIQETAAGMLGNLPINFLM
jgi:DNA-binding YbaB/EbfC family protein